MGEEDGTYFHRQAQHCPMATKRVLKAHLSPFRVLSSPSTIYWHSLKQKYKRQATVADTPQGSRIADVQAPPPPPHGGVPKMTRVPHAANHYWLVKHRRATAFFLCKLILNAKHFIACKEWCNTRENRFFGPQRQVFVLDGLPFGRNTRTVRADCCENY